MPSDIMPYYRPDELVIARVLTEIRASCKDLRSVLAEAASDYLLPALFVDRKTALMQFLSQLIYQSSCFDHVLRIFIKTGSIDILAYEAKYQAFDALHMKIEDFTRFSGRCPFLCDYGYEFFSLLAHIRLACSLLSHFLSAYIADHNIDLIALHQQQDACFHSDSAP